MVVYNIRNTKEFFAKLSACRGQVDIIWKSGAVTKLLPGKLSVEDIKWNYSDTIIDRIELKFHEPEDLSDVLMYIVNRKSYSTYSLKLNELVQAG